QIARAADRADFFPGGIDFVEIESAEACFAARRFRFKRELDRRDGQDRDEEKRDQEQARAAGERGILERQLRFFFARNFAMGLRRRLAVTRQRMRRLQRLILAYWNVRFVVHGWFYAGALPKKA